MSKTEKLVQRLLTEPADFTWDELSKVLSIYGYSEEKTGKTGGSRRKFTNSNGHLISLHKPHPSNIVKRYALRDVITLLKDKGYLG